MNEFIYFEDGWNIHEGGASSASQTTHDTEGSR